MVYLHNRLLLSNQKRYTHATGATWMEMDEIMLAEISQKGKR